MSSFVQHFSDGSLYGCLDDFFGPHEYGYIKLESIDQWYNLSEVHDWKKQVMTGENFLKKTKGLTRVHGQAPKVEEVKENKEILDIDKKLSEKFIRDYVACTPCEMGKPNSILEKLRESLIKELNKWNTKEQYYSKQEGIVLGLQIALKQLTSLETKEEPRWIPEKGQVIEVHPPGKEWEIVTFQNMTKYGYECTRFDGSIVTFSHARPLQPQFTPGQEEEWKPKKGEMIQVSDDGKYWSCPKKFLGMRETEGPFRYITESDGTEVYWIHARPLDKIDHDLVKENIRVMDEQDGKIEQVTIPYYCGRGNKFPIEKELQEINEQVSQITHFLHSQFPNSKPK